MSGFRKFYVYTFSTPKPILISIFSYNDRHIADCPEARMDMINISADGALLRSVSPFPEENRLVFKLNFELLYQPFQILGHVVSLSEAGINYNLEIQFCDLDPAVESELVRIINLMQIKDRAES